MRTMTPRRVSSSSCTGLALLCMSCASAAFAQTEVDKLNASDAASADDFGVAVSISGLRSVVGAPLDDDAGGSTGAAYVYVFDGANWIEEDKLTASDLDNGDRYGLSAAISGDAIVVGSPRDDDFGGSSGSAYVYRFDGANWIEEQKLNASDAAGNDMFGTSVAIDGDTIVIGAITDDDTANNSGSAYVFVFDGMIWSEQDKLVASDPAEIAQFGRAVAVEGDNAIVGAWQDDDTGFFTGAAYVFTRSGTVWSEEQKLKADDPADFRWFGRSVAISGDAILVGAYGDRGADLSESGGVYFFRKIAGVWTHQGNPNASDPEANARFGWAVALSGDTALVGSPNDDGVGVDSGTVYLFEFDGVAWGESGQFNASDGDAGDAFGDALAMNGASAIIGTHGGDAPAVAGAGAAYIFEFATACAADLNSDGSVGSGDLAILLSAWGGGGIADLDASGSVDSGDLAILLSAWGACS